MQTDLLTQIRAAGLPEPVAEFHFHPQRRLWRADYCFPTHCLLVEIQGGGWVQGRHHRARGYEDDCERLNEAQLLGYRMLWVTTDMVRDGSALALLERVLRGEPRG